MNDMAKNLLLWLIIAVVLLTVFQSFNPRGTGTQDLAYSDFMDKVEHNAVAEVLVRNDNRTIEAKLKDGSSVRTTFLPTDENIAELQKKVDKMRVEPSDNGISLLGILVNWAPFLIFIGFLIYVMRQMQSGGGGRGAMSFGRSRARLQG
ncbi:MAG TPA: ATP-dependent metallopeptidase FtsH/Yme1/Tma family protein, partial [Tahibacter sp.]|nr:ATP-dependent metallopeptidase FtsH/Yme1/Tma family protein [Tahibacter sp.]